MKTGDSKPTIIPGISQNSTPDYEGVEFYNSAEFQAKKLAVR